MWMWMLMMMKDRPTILALASYSGCSFGLRPRTLKAAWQHVHRGSCVAADVVLLRLAKFVLLLPFRGALLCGLS